MEWLRDKIMLLRLTAMRYFLSRKEQNQLLFQRIVSALEDPEKKDVFGCLTTNSPWKVV